MGNIQQGNFISSLRILYFNKRNSYAFFHILKAGENESSSFLNSPYCCISTTRRVFPLFYTYTFWSRIWTSISSYPAAKCPLVLIFHITLYTIDCSDPAPICTQYQYHGTVTSTTNDKPLDHRTQDHEFVLMKLPSYMIC